MKISSTLLALAATALLGGVASAQAAYHVVPDGSYARDITPDGRYVVGSVWDSVNLMTLGFIWDWRNDPAPTLIGESFPVAVSDDGTVVAGNFEDPISGNTLGGRWTQATGWVHIGELGAPCDSNRTSVYDMTGDGETIVGLGWSGCSSYSFRWTQATGIVAGDKLSLSGVPAERADAIARDTGSIHAGFAQNTSFTPAFWYADGTGLAIDPVEVGQFDGVSPDGTRLYGYISDDTLPLTAPAQAIEYDVFSGTWQVLGTGSANGAPWIGRARGVNRPCNFADRTVYGADFIGPGADAWIWRENTGIVRLNDVMAAAGVPGVPALNWVHAISDDGSTLVGHNNFGDAWIIELPTGIAEVYAGCGGNPAGSLSVLCGTPRLGTDMVVGLQNPLGSMNPGALSRLTFSLGQIANPCGYSLPGYGMAFNGAVGELLVTLPKIITLSGASWDGANPAAVLVSIPSNLPLLGATIYAQGALVDISGGVHIGLTEAISLTLGN